MILSLPLSLQRSFSVSSFCLSSQIYNEVIRDLLNPSSGFLDLREDSRGSIQIPGIMEVSTSNAQEVRGPGDPGGRRASAWAAVLATAHGAEPDTALCCSWLRGWRTYAHSPLPWPELRADIANRWLILPAVPRPRLGSLSYLAPQPVRVGCMPKPYLPS